MPRATGLPALPVAPSSVSPTPRPSAPTTPPTVFVTPPTVLPTVDVTNLMPEVTPDSCCPIGIVIVCLDRTFRLAFEVRKVVCDSWSSLQDSVPRRMEFGSRVVLFWYMRWCELGRIRASFGDCYNETADMTSRDCEMAGCLAQVQTWSQLAAGRPTPDCQSHSRTTEDVRGSCEPFSFASLATEWLLDTRWVLVERPEMG